MQIPIEWRSTFLSFLSYLLWTPFFYCLIWTISNDKKKANIFCTVFSASCLFSSLYSYFNPSQFIRYFGQIPIHSTVQFQWGPLFTRFPKEGLFFLLVLCFGITINRSLIKGGKFFYLLWILILLETWLHSSLHSPYSYLPHFERPVSANYWYHTNLFPGQLGAVNEDYFWFHQSETLYLGSQGNLTVFWTRTLPYFLSSRISTILHPYYVWIGINLIFWFLSLWAIYYLIKGYFGDKTASYSTVLLASAPGLIVYVAQPMPYALSFSLIAIFLAIFKFLLVEQNKSILSSLLTGICFSVVLLSYEFQPWFIVLPLWASSLRISMKDIVVFTVTGFILYFAFNKIPRILPGLECQNTVQLGYGDPVQNAIDLFTSFDFGKIRETLHYSIKSAWVMVFHAFSTALPFSISGAFFLYKRYKKEKGILLLILPALLACLIVGITNQPIYFKYPRIVYSSYVGMYALMALALANLETKWGRMFSLSVLTLNVLYWNADILGNSAIYFHWFYRFPGFGTWLSSAPN